MSLTFALVRHHRQRRRLAAGSVVCGFVAVGASALIVSGSGGGRTWIGRISLLAVTAALLAAAWMLARAARAGAGHLQLTDAALVIDQPELLREPLVLPWEAVRTMLVDDAQGTPVSAGSELAPRFALVEAEGPAWLHPGARSAMPVLGWEKAVPNVAVVLRGTHQLGSNPRRALALLEGNEPLRALGTCAGFFLHVVDATALGAALHERTLDPPLTLAEAEVLDQRAEDRRLRRTS